MKTQPDRQTVAEKVAEIEGEMRRVGLWQDEPLRPEQYDFRRAFAMDTMTFTQWLQFILVPRVKEIITSGEEFPAGSEVGAQAFREFVAYPGHGDFETEGLLRLLNEFDRLFKSR